MDIVELLQREIQDLKMKAGKLIEENVVLRGFKAMVMQDPKKYSKSGTCVTAEMKKDRKGHNGPPESIFDEERKKFQNYKEMYDKEHKLRQEAEGEMTILKGIETNRVKEAQDRSNHLQDELDRVKKDNNDLYNRIAELTEVEESHRKMNGKLQERLTEVEEDNKKLSKQVEDRIDQLRRSGM